MIILAIAFLVLCVIAATKESKVTGLYKAFGVYGRVSAYFSLFAPMGLVAFVAGFFVKGMFPGNFLYLLIAALGALFIWNSYRKCPDFLKKKMIVSMLFSGFGVALKICFFFLGFVWKLTGPQEMVDEDGNTVYVYSGSVYSADGSHIGEVTSDGNSFIKTEN